MTLFRNVSAAPVDLPDGRVLGVGDDADLPGVPPRLDGRLAEVQTGPEPSEESSEEPQADAEASKKTTHHRTTHSKS